MARRRGGRRAAGGCLPIGTCTGQTPATCRASSQLPWDYPARRGGSWPGPEGPSLANARSRFEGSRSHAAGASSHPVETREGREGGFHLQYPLYIHICLTAVDLFLLEHLPSFFDLKMPRRTGLIATQRCLAHLLHLL